MTKKEYKQKILEFRNEASKSKDFFESASICKRFREFCNTVDPSIVDRCPVLLDSKGDILDMYSFNGIKLVDVKFNFKKIEFSYR